MKISPNLNYLDIRKLIRNIRGRSHMMSATEGGGGRGNQPIISDFSLQGGEGGAWLVIYWSLAETYSPIW